MTSLICNLRNLLRPSIDALFARNLTFAQRWRMLFLLQPTSFLTYSIASLPWLFSRAFTAEYITVDSGRTVRILVFKSKERPSDPNYGKLRPLHLDVHGGGF